MNEDLGLQDIVQALFVYKAEVGHNSVWVCRIIRRDRKVTLVQYKLKEIFGINKSLKKK